MKVLVVDLELEARDIVGRHHSAIVKMDSAAIDNLLYLHEKIENNMMIGYQLIEKIEEAALEHGAQLVIIDNMSKLLPDALKPDAVTFIIEFLKRVRKRTGASILVIGHTTKGNLRVAISPPIFST